MPVTSLKEPKWHHRTMILAVLNVVCLINAQQLCLRSFIDLYIKKKKINLLSRKLKTLHFLKLGASAQTHKHPVTPSRHLLARSGGSFSQFSVCPKCPQTTSVSLLCCSFFFALLSIWFFAAVSKQKKKKNIP